MKMSKRPFRWLLGLVVVAAFGSCKKDGLNSKELLVFLKGGYAEIDNRVILPYIHTPVSVIGNTMVEIPAYATREVPAEIHVTIAPDMTLIGQFNQANNTDFQAVPQSAYRIINPGALTINEGELVSGQALQIEITDPAALTDPRGYLLPLTITGIEGKDKGARISTSHGTAFINVTYEFTNVKASEEPVAGTILDRSAWVGQVSNTSSGTSAADLLDGNNNTRWRSSNSSTAPKWIIMDMGVEENLKGISMIPNYSSTTENPTQILVSTSTDNVNWTEQGIWNGTGPAPGSNASNPDAKGIEFYGAVQARYFRLDILKSLNTRRVGLAEVYAVE